MTEPSPSASGARPRPRRGSLAAGWLAGTVFLLVLLALAVRVAGGQDPALRARAAAQPPPARRILLRRIYERRVIVHLPPSAPPQPPRSIEQAGAMGVYPAPVTRTS